MHDVIEKLQHHGFRDPEMGLLKYAKDKVNRATKNQSAKKSMRKMRERKANEKLALNTRV